jgi:hypothetical protein
MGSQLTRPPTLLEITEPTALPTATSHTTHGPLRGAEAITLEKGRPEAEATASSEVVLTTGEDSLDGAGGGRGGAGRPLESAVNIEAAPQCRRTSLKKSQLVFKTIDVADLFQTYLLLIVVYNSLSMCRKKNIKM